MHEPETISPNGRSRTRRVLIAATAVLLVVTAAVAVSGRMDIGPRVAALLAWIDGMGTWGPLILIAADILVVVLVLPGVWLTLGAGFLFGVVEGSLYIVIGTSIGATIAFLVARHLLGPRSAAWLARHPRARLLESMLTESGWKIVLATRLIPFFPFKLANYVFGLARFRLRDFVAGTVLGIIPFTVTNVYIGSLAADLAMLGVRGGPRESWEWLLYAGGALVACAVVVYLARIARRILKAELERGEPACRG